MSPLSPGMVMTGDLNNRREKQKEIKGKLLIHAVMTPLSTPGSAMKGDPYTRR